MSKLQDITYTARSGFFSYALAGGAGSRRGTGGMRTKLQAASLAMDNGIDTVITNGKHPESLYDILTGKSIGTLFMGKL